MADDSRTVTMLAEEVLALRMQLRRTRQESAAFQEEMQTSNEELLVANEELRAKAEELEVGKQEMRALNAEERFQQVVEHAPSGMLMVNREDNIVLVNAQIETSFGYRRAELLGQSVDLLIPAPMRQDHILYRHDYLADPTARPMGAGRELLGLHKHGHTFPIEVGLTPIITEAGLMVLCTVLDVTERKQAEATQARLLKEVGRQHAQLRRLAKELATAQETERKELAHELHDRVGQNLTALNLALSLIQNRLASQLAVEDSVFARIADAQHLIEQITEQTRNVMADLHPPTLDDYGLLATLRWYADHLMQRTGMPIRIDGEEPVPRLGETAELTLFRIVQEALTNALKHAHATQLTVTVTADDAQVQLQIVDNGCGFVPTTTGSAEPKGWGIPIMQERIAAIGGTFQMESNPNQGTAIVVEVKR